MHTIFITGGTGCIGSVTIHQLLQSENISKIIVASRSGSSKLLNLWLDPQKDPRLEFISLDVADYGEVAVKLKDINPTHIIHLGAYQSPDCSAYHFRGMEINTGGTMALLDAAEQLPRLQRMVFASSAAVYGMRAMYPSPGITEDASLAPPNHYGIWKLAGEHLSRLFYEKTEIPTICLRLNTTYGKGRDKGKTSAPTNALKAIAMGASRGKKIPFEMPYGGRENYHFVEDVGMHFAACTLQPFDGFGVFNIKGETIPITEFLNLATQEASKLGMEAFTALSVAENTPPNLFVSDLSHDKIDQAFRNLPLTPIAEGIGKTLREFQKMAANGLLATTTESA